MNNNIITYRETKIWYLEDDIQRPYTDDAEWINDQLYIKGKLVHREDGPAMEWGNGDKDYLQYGKVHRIGGPAREWINGSKEYYENGKRHREDGAAAIYNNGKRKIYEYWLCGKKFKTKKDMIHYRDYLMILD
jgi:hypothetical protein